MVNGGGQMCSFAVYITCVGLEAVCVKTTENCSSEQRLVKIQSKTGNEQRYYFAWKRQKPFAPGAIYYKYVLRGQF